MTHFAIAEVEELAKTPPWNYYEKAETGVVKTTSESARTFDGVENDAWNANENSASRIETGVHNLNTVEASLYDDDCGSNLRGLEKEEH